MEGRSKMKGLLLDGRCIESREALHSAFSQGLAFPDYYGKNLDALFDLLSTFPEDVDIQICHWRELYRRLGPYAQRLMDALWHACRDNPRLRLSCYSDRPPEKGECPPREP